jgi:hypothetical protein
MPLVFEKPQAGVQVDFTGLSEAEAVAKLMAINDRLPPHPSTINLGCGPEPEDINLEAVTLALSAMMSVGDGEPIDSARMEFANRTGARFYWRYATKLAINELNSEMSEDEADEAIYGEQRAVFCQRRRQKLRWVFKERFGIDLN